MQITPLLKLHHELAIKKGMSYEATSNIVDLALCKLPYMGTLYEQANEEVSKKQDGVDYLENRKYSLKKGKEYSHNIIMSTMKLIDYNHCRHLIRY